MFVSFVGERGMFCGVYVRVLVQARCCWLSVCESGESSAVS